MRRGQRRKLQTLGAMALFLLASCATGTGGNASTASSAPIGPRNESRIPLLSRLFLHHSSPAPSPVTPPPVKAVSTPPPAPAPQKPQGLFANIPDDPSIQLYMDYFEYAQHRQFKKWLERSHEFLPTIRATFRQEGLPEDLAYLSLIESGFSARAYSRSGAAGLWQFMRGTGIKYGLQVNWWIDQRRDPVLATRSAALYLKDLHEEFGSWALALAAYNAGEGRVANAVARTGTKDYWKKSRESRGIRLSFRGADGADDAVEALPPVPVAQEARRKRAMAPKAWSFRLCPGLISAFLP